MWWCPMCEEELQPIDMDRTCRCKDCGTEVEWKDIDDEPFMTEEQFEQFMDTAGYED